MHRFDVKTIKTFELGRKTTKVIKLLWIASIWHQNNLKCGDTGQNYKSNQITMNCIDLMSNDLKCWDTSQNIQNYAKLRKSSNYNELHRFDVKKIKPTQNYKSDLISMNWDRFDLKTIKNVEVRRKTLKTTENYKTDQLQWIASTSGQNDQKTQNYKRNQITSNLHRFDIKTIKTTQN